MVGNKDKIPREKWATNKARTNEYEKGPQSFFCAQDANDNASTLSALTETQSVSRGAEAQQHALAKTKVIIIV